MRWPTLSCELAGDACFDEKANSAPTRSRLLVVSVPFLPEAHALGEIFRTSETKMGRIPSYSAMSS